MRAPVTARTTTSGETSGAGPVPGTGPTLVITAPYGPPRPASSGSHFAVTGGATPAAGYVPAPEPRGRVSAQEHPGQDAPGAPRAGLPLPVDPLGQACVAAQPHTLGLVQEVL